MCSWSVRGRDFAIKSRFLYSFSDTCPLAVDTVGPLLSGHHWDSIFCPLKWGVLYSGVENNCNRIFGTLVSVLYIIDVLCSGVSFKRGSTLSKNLVKNLSKILKESCLQARFDKTWQDFGTRILQDRQDYSCCQDLARFWNKSC